MRRVLGGRAWIGGAAVPSTSPRSAPVSFTTIPRCDFQQRRLHARSAGASGFLSRISALYFQEGGRSSARRWRGPRTVSMLSPSMTATSAEFRDRTKELRGRLALLTESL